MEKLKQVWFLIVAILALALLSANGVSADGPGSSDADEWFSELGEQAQELTDKGEVPAAIEPGEEIPANGLPFEDYNSPAGAPQPPTYGASPHPASAPASAGNGSAWVLERVTIIPSSGVAQWWMATTSNPSATVSETTITHAWDQEAYGGYGGEGPITYRSNFSFTFTRPPETLNPGSVISLTVTGTGRATGEDLSSIYSIEDIILYTVYEYDKRYDDHSMEVAGMPPISHVSDPFFRLSGQPPGPFTDEHTISFTVPEVHAGEIVVVAELASNDAYQTVEKPRIEWVYRSGESDKVNIDMDYYPPLQYFPPGDSSGSGADAWLGWAGDIVVTLTDEDGAPIEGKRVMFFIDREAAAGEPGRNLFDVLAYDVAEGTGPIGSIETHHLLTKQVLNPELDKSLFKDDRIFLGSGIITDSNGQAIINLIKESIVDPRKFSAELISQRSQFSERGMVSGTIVAGVYDEETKFLQPQASYLIEYPAMAKIMSITGEGPDDAYKEAFRRQYPDSPEWGPGKVRVKRAVASPNFDYRPVEDSDQFLLMPGDIVDIDAGVAVEIAWINGDRVIARVPTKSEAKTSTEYHEHASLIMLSSAYDSGFLTTGEKIYNSVFGFGAKKGIEFVIESIPVVGKALKEGGNLTIEIFKGLQDVDLTQADIITRIRIRSRVIIDNTGDDLKIYTIEGSPEVETVAGGELTLSSGEMVTVSGEGVLGEAEAFDVQAVESDYHELMSLSASNEDQGDGSVPPATRPADQPSDSGGSGIWYFVGAGVAFVLLIVVLLRRRSRGT